MQRADPGPAGGGTEGAVNGKGGENEMRIRTVLATAAALIAATAAVHGKIIVTRNVEDFSDTRLPVINPWNR